jgi:Tfp pilus assembly protein PilF
VRESVIATNYHVIKGAFSASARIVGQEESHSVVGFAAVDVQRDVILLQVEGIKAQPLSLADISRLEVGEEVYALGNPQGLEGTISPGIVSGIGIRQIQGEEYIQITAPISAGSSGGPVVNGKAEVIGMATSFLRNGQNLNFAVPSPFIALLLANIKAPSPLGTLSPKSGTTGTTDPKIEETLCGGPENPNVARLGYGVEGYRTFAAQSIMAGRYLGARDAELMVLRINPNDRSAHENLGFIYSRLSCYEKALEEYQKQIRYTPDKAAVYYGIGYAYAQLNKHTEAVESFKEAIKFNPRDGASHYSLALSYAGLKRNNEALAEFIECIKLEHMKEGSYVQMGIIYLFDFKQLNEAMYAFKQALRVNPQSPNAHLGLGTIYVKLGDKEKAFEEYRRLVVLDQKMAELLQSTIREKWK